MWESQINGKRIKELYLVQNGTAKPIKDMYSVVNGEAKRWKRAGGHYIPEHYYIQKEDETFLFLSEDGLPIITE